MNILFLNLLLIATPSLFLPFLQEQFETPKYFFVVFILVVNLLLNVKTKLQNIKLNFTLADKILTFYLFWYLVTSLFSVHPFVSFFGLPQHLSGSFVFIFLLFFYLFLNKKFIKKLPSIYFLYALLFSSFIPVTYGLIQALSLDFLKWDSPSGGRVFSTFGQPNFFALYLLLVSYSLIVFILEKRRKEYLIYFVPVFILFLKTLSLSSFIVFIFFLPVYLFFRKKQISARNFIYFLIILTTTLLIFGGPLLNRFTTQIYAEEKSIVVTNDTAKIRKILTISSLKQIMSNPRLYLIGSGPETFYLLITEILI